jgi:protein-tyrosine-phosphatase
MPSILYVCTANQCRSPIAMALMRKQLQQLGLGEDWQVESAGTWAIDGFPATNYAIQVMEERGLLLKDHRSRKVTAEMLAGMDLVLTMEKNHAEALRNEFPEQDEKVYVLSEMVGEHWDLVDPIGGSLEDYQTAAKLLDDTISEGLERMLELARTNADQRQAEKKP